MMSISKTIALSMSIIVLFFIITNKLDKSKLKLEQHKDGFNTNDINHDIADSIELHSISDDGKLFNIKAKKMIKKNDDNEITLFNITAQLELNDFSKVYLKAPISSIDLLKKRFSAKEKEEFYLTIINNGNSKTYNLFLENIEINYKDRIALTGKNLQLRIEKIYLTSNNISLDSEDRIIFKEKVRLEVKNIDLKIKNQFLIQ